jgi:F0F1-type ATP synthase delta subunit
MHKILVQFPKFASRTAHNKLDAHLIGGFVIQSGSELIDLSIRNALHLLKKQLYESN